jgi:CO/xanthine dehydrogenase Mo-binding subunit
VLAPQVEVTVGAYAGDEGSTREGIGEASILPGPAAIAHAIAAAAGIRMRDLPMTQAAVWAAARRRTG